MLAWLRKKKASAPSARDFAASTTVHAPPSPTPPHPDGSPAPDLLLVGRQPIVNNQQDIIGYQLMFRDVAAPGGDTAGATGEALLNTLNNLGLERVLGGARAFIKLPEAMLDHEILHLLPARCMVLELPGSLPLTPAVIARCAALRAAGFRLALGGFRYQPALDPLLNVMDYALLDFTRMSDAEARAEVYALRGRRLRIVAEHVATREAFALGRSLYVNNYQGYFFAQPEVLRAKRVDPQAQRVMRLFNLVSGGAEHALIEQEFKLDVGLSLSLLRYINSPGMGLGEEVRSIRHALVVLGQARMARWVSLLLMRGGESRPTPPALMKTALLRARFTERLASTTLPRERDNLFMLGMLSLLDVLCEMPMEEALAGLKLAPELSEALAQGTGRYAPYLQLALACEAGDWTRSGILCESLGLAPERAAQMQLQAMTWVAEMKL